MAPTGLSIAVLCIADGGRTLFAPTVCALFSKNKKFSLFLRHPERANKREPKDLDRAKQARARCVCAKLLCKRYFACIELQRFYLDPATASRCGLLVCFAAPRKLRLRSGWHGRENIADGGVGRGLAPAVLCIVDCGGTKERAFAKQKRRARIALCASEDNRPYCLCVAVSRTTVCRFFDILRFFCIYWK